MKKQKLVFILVVVVCLFISSLSSSIQASDVKKKAKKHFEPTWDSLRQKSATEQWYEDAVLGFYFHWGPYTVPGFGCAGYWTMYMPDSGTYRLVERKYGKPGVEFGYKDFVPMWKAENYNPKEWAKLFKHAGADYAGPGAEHHDGFALWDTEFDDWNSVDMGPKVDIVGTLVEACRNEGLKTCVAVHNWRTYITYDAGRRLCPPGVDVNDPKYAGLYGPPKKSTHRRPIDNDYPGADWPKEHWDERWNKWKELVDKYKIDLIWCEHMDSGEPPDELKRKMLAYYFNSAEEWDKDVVVTSKKLRPTHRQDMPGFCTVLNMEIETPPHPKPAKWQCDYPLGESWAWTPHVGCRPTNEMVDFIVDNTSKNGLTMFSVAPKADGTLPKAQIKGLTELGDWMKINKEALHGTTPAPFVVGGTHDWKQGSIRFTRKAEYLYAIDLEKPKVPLRIRNVTALEGSEIKMLGSDKPLKWRQEIDEEDDDEPGIVVIEELPDPLPCDHAWAFKIRVLDEAW